MCPGTATHNIKCVKNIYILYANKNGKNDNSRYQCLDLPVR